MLGFLSSVTLILTIAANRMKIEAFGFSKNLEFDIYNAERTTIIIIISHFFGQIPLKLIQVCYFLIERTRDRGWDVFMCVFYFGNNWTVGTLL